MRLKVIKSTNYTTIDNNIFRNYALSFKAKGLLCQMLSLPDNWDFSIQGLASLGKENKDAVRTALKELEEAGYLKRARERDKGQYAGAEYIVSETPMTDDETAEEKSEKPMSEKPTWENPTHINNIPNKVLKELSTKDIHNSDVGKSEEEEVLTAYNAMCPSLPRARILTDTRRSHIRARLKKHSIAEIRQVFQIAEESDFLSGRKSDWQADFDWLTKGETNFVKVLEGNYKNRNAEKEKFIQDMREITKGMTREEYEKAEEMFR